MRDRQAPVAEVGLGNPEHPEWLKLRIAGGGLSINGNRAVYAHLEAPDGNLTLNGGSRFVGAVASDRFTVNGNAVLRLVIANQPPSVTLTAPTEGASFTVPVSLSLSATATDPDGSVAKVEFYDGSQKLGEAASAPFTLAATIATPGLHALHARAIDDRGTAVDSATITVRLLPGLPYLADFETAEGYALGSLHDQLGWAVATGTAQVTAVASVQGAQSVLLSPGATVALADQEFGPGATNPTPVFVEVFARPVAGATPGAGSQFDLDNARLAFAHDGTTGRFAALAGDGIGGGTWQTLGASVAIDSNQTAGWLRLTTRLDYTAKTWDFYLNGRMLAYDLKFRFNAATYLSGLSFQGHPTSASYFDDLYAGAENPLFADTDHDGLDDAWETARGLNPSLNDRNGDLDGDGLSNVLEYLLGTHPGQADTDADGLPDGWERQHSFDPTQSNPTGADTDADGLKDTQEFAAGTNPRQVDTDGDGLPDTWEVTHSLNPLAPADAAADADGDGLTNLQEYQQGKDPADYFNGVLPNMTPQVPASGELGPGDTLSVKITNAAGVPLSNAPVTASVKEGGHFLSATPTGQKSTTVTVRSGTDGIAVIYVRSTEE